MTEATGNHAQKRNIVLIGLLTGLVFAGGAFALMHNHAHAAAVANTPAARHLSTTHPEATTHPATTRAVVKHKKKKT
jgi:hypothetical protein